MHPCGRQSRVARDISAQSTVGDGAGQVRRSGSQRVLDGCMAFILQVRGDASDGDV